MKSILKLAMILWVFLDSSLSLAGVHFGISGYTRTSNAGINRSQEQSGKASVAVDLGSYFRIGVSGMREYETQDGYKLDPNDTSRLQAYTYSTVETSESLDLTAVLYSGELFTPFVFVGMVWKQYQFNEKDENGDSTGNQTLSLGPLPNGGGGLAISLSKAFSLKITYTISPGQKVDPVTGEQESVRDDRTDIGLSYAIY